MMLAKPGRGKPERQVTGAQRFFSWPCVAGVSQTAKPPARGRRKGAAMATHGDTDFYAERPNRLPWPPMIYTGAFALAFALQETAALRILDQALAQAPRAAGFIVIVVGLAIDLAAMWALARRRTAIMPNAAASALVSDGVFAWSRNPIYLGNTVLLAGAALALRWGWLILLAPVTVIAVTRLAIEREERHLAARFGEDWRAYAARVGRWL